MDGKIRVRAKPLMLRLCSRQLLVHCSTSRIRASRARPVCREKPFREVIFGEILNHRLAFQADKVDKRILRHGLGKQVALQIFTTHCGQYLALNLGFDAFGDDF